MKKHTLEEIKEMLLEPTFDLEAHTEKEVGPNYVIDIIEDAIAHHEKLSNDNNAEHQ